MQNKNNIIIESLFQKKENNEILKDINLTIPSKKVVCLVGPSGSGKTSLLRVLAGLDKFQSGRIFFNKILYAKSNYEIPAEKRNFGFVFQESNLFPHLNVFKNVSFGIKDKNFKSTQKKTFNILSKVGLPHFANVYPEKLSSGQKQLVSLARSLITNPKLLLMDEPFSNLDQRLKNKIRDITLHLLQKTSTTALIVTHDPEEAIFMGDYIAVMNQGRIIQFSNPHDIYNKPETPFVARFFGETISLRSKIKKGKVATIFGEIEVPKFRENSNVEIIFRSESFDIKRNKNKKNNLIKGKIMAIKEIGQNTMLHLDVRNKNFSKHIHIKISGKFFPPKNKICYISINKKYTFIFNV